jgi:Bacterial PH domain
VREPPSGKRSPVIVSKYLLPREVEVAWVKRHRACLVVPVVQAFGGMVVGIIATYAIPETPARLFVLWAVVGLLLAHLVRMTARWSVEYFVVTSERVMLVSGFGHRLMLQIPLSALTDISFARSWAGRLLGYGAYIADIGGRPKLISDFVPYPEDLYVLICGMLFPSSADDEDAESRPTGAY